MSARWLILTAVILSVSIGSISPSLGQQSPRVEFSAAEKGIIAAYLTSNPHLLIDDEPEGRGQGKGQAKGKGKSGDMPAGLGGRDQLPPGLQMHIERNGTLPPGLEKRDLPSDLTGLLPQVQRGTRRVIVGRDIVLMDIATNVVIDVLADVLRR